MRTGAGRSMLTTGHHPDRSSRPGRGSPDSRLGEPSQLYPRGHLRCVKTQASETMQPMAVVKANVAQEASIAGPSMALFPGRDDWNRARADADLTTTGH